MPSNNAKNPRQTTNPLHQKNANTQMTQDGSQTEIVAQEMSQIYICQMLWGLQIESKTLATKKPTSNKQQSNNL